MNFYKIKTKKTDCKNILLYNIRKLISLYILNQKKHLTSRFNKNFVFFKQLKMNNKMIMFTLLNVINEKFIQKHMIDIANQFYSK